MSEYMNAIRAGKMQEFRTRYREGVDALRGQYRVADLSPREEKKGKAMRKSPRAPRIDPDMKRVPRSKSVRKAPAAEIRRQSPPRATSSKTRCAPSGPPPPSPPSPSSTLPPLIAIPTHHGPISIQNRWVAGAAVLIVGLLAAALVLAVVLDRPWIVALVHGPR